MQIPNNTWVLVGTATPTFLVMQNVGDSSIAYCYAADQTQADAHDVNSDDVFILDRRSEPLTIKELDDQGLSVFARSRGPITGKLAVKTV